MRKSLAVLTSLLGLAACGASLNQTDLLGHEGLGLAIKRYYSDNAFEENASCTSVRINTITQAQIVEESDKELVVQLRYYYLDDLREERVIRVGTQEITVPMCRDFSTRVFKVGKTTDGLQVTAMSGEQRS